MVRLARRVYVWLIVLDKSTNKIESPETAKVSGLFCLKDILIPTPIGKCAPARQMMVYTFTMILGFF